MAKALPLLLLLLAACDAQTATPTAALAAEVQADGRRASAPLPALSGRVVDAANILPGAVETRLTVKLAELERRTSDQLVVVTTPSLAGETIDSFGLRLGRSWGIGQEGLDNGVLLIVAPNDRKVRIEVGYGLEGLLTDERAAAIIQETLLPRLRQGAYGEATEAGVADIFTLLTTEPQRPRRRAS